MYVRTWPPLFVFFPHCFFMPPCSFFPFSPYLCSLYPLLLYTSSCFSLYFLTIKTTVAGFEPAPPEEKWFRVTRLRPLGHAVLYYITLCLFKFPVKMQVVGFDPTPPKRLVPETSALDHSATLAVIYYIIWLWYTNWYKILLLDYDYTTRWLFYIYFMSYLLLFLMNIYREWENERKGEIVCEIERKKERKKKRKKIKLEEKRRLEDEKSKK